MGVGYVVFGVVPPPGLFGPGGSDCLLISGLGNGYKVMYLLYHAADGGGVFLYHGVVHLAQA